MENGSYPIVVSSACLACKRGKRRCNKSVPTCSTCLRVGRRCCYSESSTSSHASLPPSLQNDRQHVPQVSPSGFSASPVWTHLNLTTASPSRPSLNLIVAQEAFKTLGGVADVQKTSDIFFRSVHKMIPFVSKRRFNERLSTIWLNPCSGFIALALCMQLLVQFPKDSNDDMRSLLYVTAKSMITFQESAGIVSIELLQSRLLIAVYETGHGLNPAASISISACAATGHALGLDQKLQVQNNQKSASSMASEEERRLWWSILIIERYINLVNNADHFSIKDPGSQALLPIDEDSWEQDVGVTQSIQNSELRTDQETANTTPVTISALSCTLVGSLARQCQISYLVGRVLTHIFTPSSDSQFNLDEGHQLKLTLNAYYDVLLEGVGTGKGKAYCPAFGICSSALVSLYRNHLAQGHGNEDAVLTSLGSIAGAMVHFSDLFCETEEDLEIESLSFLVPNAFYQAALVQQRLWKETSNHRYKRGFVSMKMRLEQHDRRWKTAGLYQKALEELSAQQVV